MYVRLQARDGAAAAGEDGARGGVATDSRRHQRGEFPSAVMRLYQL